MIGIVHIADETYITDRDNAARVPVERVDLKPTWDIDRSGSKGQVSVTADAGVLEPGMWISTYRTITPERGPIIRYPRGHWHLSRPGIAYPGGHETDSGNVAVQQTASGSDIVDDIAGVLLTEAFYTMRGSRITPEIRTLIKMATCGIMGPNLLPNGSFENEGAGWNGLAFYGGASGTIQWAPSQAWGTPDGVKAFRAVYNPSTPAQGYSLAWSNTIAVPPGTMFMYASGLHYNPSDMGATLAIRFYDGLGNIVSSSLSGDSYESFSPGGLWTRTFFVAPVPLGAETFEVRILSRELLGGRSVSAVWDDIRVGTCTMMPLPDSRINFPHSEAVAANRIQTDEGKSIGYDAINADRLGAIGYNAIATDMDGRLTTRPMRTLADAMPQYTFGPDDLALIGDVEIPATNVRPHNHWIAVKEDFEDANASLRADSYNNNANDPFSVANSGSVYSAPPITVQDAVDQAALQALADQARDAYSMNETVRFACMPLPDLDVYSVIAIDDPEMPHVSGKWAVNSIDASGDYLVITATRAISREV